MRKGESLPLAERLKSKFIEGHISECWEWLGCISERGYGRMRENRRTRPAHEIVYEFYTNKTKPIGLEFDHLCYNRKCVNPNHLEFVTRQENCFRKRKALFCKNGHPFDEENTEYCKKPRKGKVFYGRRCKKCHREEGVIYQRERRLRLKNAKV